MSTVSEAFLKATENATTDDALVAEIRDRATQIHNWHEENPNSDTPGARLPEPEKAFDLRLIELPS